MAETLQKVFMIFVRPATFTNGIPTVKKTGLLVATGTNANGDATYGAVTTNNPTTTTTTDDTSPLRLNKSGAFEKDPWFLHSCYTSYEDFKASLRVLMNTYAVGDIRCGIYLPTDFEVTPFE
jgi:hypothetical protein